MGHMCDIIKSHTPQVGDAQTGEQLGHRSSPIGERAEPHTRLPSLGGLASGGGALREFDFAGQWGLLKGTPQDRGKQKPTVGGYMEGLTH